MATALDAIADVLDRVLEVGIVMCESERRLVEPESLPELPFAVVDLGKTANGRQILGARCAARSSSSTAAASRSPTSMSARPSVTRADR